MGLPIVSSSSTGSFPTLQRAQSFGGEGEGVGGGRRKHERAASREEEEEEEEEEGWVGIRPTIG